MEAGLGLLVSKLAFFGLLVWAWMSARRSAREAREARAAREAAALAEAPAHADLPRAA